MTEITEENAKTNNKEKTEIPEITPPVAQHHKMKIKPLYIILGVVIVILIIGIAVSFKLFTDSQQKLAAIQSGGITPTPTELQIKELVKKVGRHILLPEGLPKVISVSNVETLKKEQPFFEKASNGNLLLIYPQRVIIYDPTGDKIIDIAQIRATPAVSESPAGSSATASGTGPSSTPIPTPTVDRAINLSIYNGTNKVGLSASAEKELESKFPEIVIASKENANNRDYPKTLVVDLTGRDKTEVASIAKDFNATLTSLPVGEDQPSGTTSKVDIILILGKDYIK